jgi:hypothetical protein
MESGKKRGRLGCPLCLDWCSESDEGWVPALEVVGELVVQDAAADLEQQVSPLGCPAHLRTIGIRLNIV